MLLPLWPEDGSRVQQSILTEHDQASAMNARPISDFVGQNSEGFICTHALPQSVINNAFIINSLLANAVDRCNQWLLDIFAK
jgi:hypothetical protein